MPARNLMWIAVAAALLLAGCKKENKPDPAAQTGIASWYGHPYTAGYGQRRNL